MGLDMYLTKKIYVGANYEHRGVTGKIDIKVGDEKLKVNFNRVSYIEERIGYWRKANSIHSWFVEKVQNSEDDCNPHYVSRENLEELLDICKKVLNSTKLVDGKIPNGTSYSVENGQVEHWEDGKILENAILAEEFLPSKGGFFFGGTNYDEYYWQDLLDTVSILEEVLKEIDDNSEIYYESSW